jgi:hypothetical protein
MNKKKRNTRLGNYDRLGTQWSLYASAMVSRGKKKNTGKWGKIGECVEYKERRKEKLHV